MGTTIKMHHHHLHRRVITSNYGIITSTQNLKLFVFSFELPSHIYVTIWLYLAAFNSIAKPTEM